MTLKSFFIFLLMSTVFLSCVDKNKSENARILAKAGPYSLTDRQLNSYLIDQYIKIDTAYKKEVVIQRWVKDKLFLEVANNEIKNDSIIKVMVSNYRSSLIQHLYEKQLLEQELDSTIAQTELNEYYEANKSQFILETSILRCQLLKINKDQKEIIQSINKFWDFKNEEDRDSLIHLANAYAELFILEDSTWYRVDEIKALIPKGMLGPGSHRPKDIRFTDDSAKYFLRIFEVLPDTEVAPLSFIEKQARKVIFHKRKVTLIRQKRKELYDQAIKSKHAIIYSEKTNKIN